MDEVVFGRVDGLWARVWARAGPARVKDFRYLLTLYYRTCFGETRQEISEVFAEIEGVVRKCNNGSVTIRKMSPEKDSVRHDS